MRTSVISKARCSVVSVASASWLSGSSCAASSSGSSAWWRTPKWRSSGYVGSAPRTSADCEKRRSVRATCTAHARKRHQDPSDSQVRDAMCHDQVYRVHTQAEAVCCAGGLLNVLLSRSSASFASTLCVPTLRARPRA
eukprot:4661803-Prymnesium_polylepis.1